MCSRCSAGGCLQALHAAKGLVAAYPGTHGHLASLIGAWVRLKDLTGAPHATAFQALAFGRFMPQCVHRGAWRSRLHGMSAACHTIFIWI